MRTRACLRVHLQNPKEVWEGSWQSGNLEWFPSGFSSVVSFHISEHPSKENMRGRSQRDERRMAEFLRESHQERKSRMCEAAENNA